METLCGGISFELPRHMFLWRNKKKYQLFLVEKKNKQKQPTLIGVMKALYTNLFFFPAIKYYQ